MDTPAEAGAALGRAARATSPRSAHADWARAADGPDPVAILRRQAETRHPSLVPIRHGRMLRSPFAFFRGSAALMAADLAGTPVTGIRTQLCGDAHLSNFGGFAAPDRALVFDVNDFDETAPGPWEWDVKRLAASVAVAGRDRGFDAAARAPAVRGAVTAYRAAMRRFAAMGTLDVWYARDDVEDRLRGLRGRMTAARAHDAERAVAKARRRDSTRAVARFAHEVDGELRIVSDPPLVIPLRELLGDADRRETEEWLLGILGAYAATLPDHRRHLLSGYRVVDVAHKVVGVGSVGLMAWMLLLLGGDADDPLVLQVKEAEASVLEPFAGASRYRMRGRRVVEGQRLMQAATDPFLGWVRVDGGSDGRRHDLYVRQLWDAKLSVPVETMEPAALTEYARICGGALARAHARAGDRWAIAAYLGKRDRFDRAVAGFAERYADQNERDFAALVRAVERDQLAAERGV